MRSAGGRQRGGAIFGAAVAVMSLGALGVSVDHAWVRMNQAMVEVAAEAAATAAADAYRGIDKTQSVAEQEAEVGEVAKRYAIWAVRRNARYQVSAEEVQTRIAIDDMTGAVSAEVEAAVPGFLFARKLYGIGGPESAIGRAGIEVDASKVEIVVAVNTGSAMGQLLPRVGGTKSRMAYTQEAISTLLDVLDVGTRQGVAVGVVPWTGIVRLDSAARTDWVDANWISYPSSRYYHNPYRGAKSGVTQTLPANPPSAWLGCVHHRRVDPDVPGGGRPGLDTSHPGTNPFTQSFYFASNATAYQCLDPTTTPTTLRQQSCYDGSSVTAPWPTHTHRSTTLEVQGQCNLEPMLPLTTDHQAIRDRVDDFQPRGGTNHSVLGLMWGARMLDYAWQDVWGGSVHPADPDQEIEKFATPMTKAIILLTDGEDYWTTSDERTNMPDASPTREEACDAVKAMGIRIYVVAAIEPGEQYQHAQAIAGLPDCSSRDDDPSGEYVFINNSDGNDLKTAFRKIGEQMVRTRRIP